MVDIEKIEKLMVLMAKHGFDVVQAESHGEKFSLARNAGQAGFFNAPGASLAGTSLASFPPAKSSSFSSESSETTPTVAAPVSPVSSNEAPVPQPQGEVVTSPFVGTFYRAPGPDSAAFVNVGSRVKKGQPLCIVEAMKLMNEIECEIEGEVVAILVDNAKPVEFGTPLFIIAPTK